MIDFNQGQSGASAADREGFQRLVGEVGIGRVGIVLGLEVSRLARNNADWHRLLEICALTATLICDEDGLYDPADFDDRLLLGLKGTMSEAELHFIRARLQGSMLSKARRGELRTPLPVGLSYDPVGNASFLNPDHVRSGALWSFSFRHISRGPARPARSCWRSPPTACCSLPGSAAGPRKDELAWSELEHWQVLRALHNPRYAGAFAYGRRRNRRGGSLTGRTISNALPREQWTALIPDTAPRVPHVRAVRDRPPGARRDAHAHGEDRAGGPAREGPALLQGLAICGNCGKRMTVRYHERRGVTFCLTTNALGITIQR